MPLEKASHLGLRLRRDPTANTPRVESLVAVCTCVRALFSPEEEARPSLQLTLVSPVLETQPWLATTPSSSLRGRAGKTPPQCTLSLFPVCNDGGGLAGGSPGG